MDDDNVKMAPHKLEVCQHLTPLGQKLFRYVEFDEDESLLAEIHKHPVGLAFIWLTGGLITSIVVIAGYFLATGAGSPTVDATNQSAFNAIILFAALFISLAVFIVTAITAYLYKSSTVFVTNEKMAEVVYVSLFNRRVTQMGIGNVEDVTVAQRGILPRIFHYGSLLVETAGEKTSPEFTYVPQPNQTAQVIIQAHEAYVEKFGN